MLHAPSSSGKPFIMFLSFCEYMGSVAYPELCKAVQELRKYGGSFCWLCIGSHQALGFIFHVFSFVEFYVDGVPPAPRVLWILELFDCEGFLNDIRGNRTCKIQPVKGHREVLSY